MGPRSMHIYMKTYAQSSKMFAKHGLTTWSVRDDSADRHTAHTHTHTHILVFVSLSVSFVGGFFLYVFLATGWRFVLSFFLCLFVDHHHHFAAHCRPHEWCAIRFFCRHPSTIYLSQDVCPSLGSKLGEDTDTETFVIFLLTLSQKGYVTIPCHAGLSRRLHVALFYWPDGEEESSCLLKYFSNHQVSRRIVLLYFLDREWGLFEMRHQDPTHIFALAVHLLKIRVGLNQEIPWSIIHFPHWQRPSLDISWTFVDIVQQMSKLGRFQCVCMGPYIHMCTLYTYTNTYMPRFSPSGWFLVSSGPPGISSGGGDGC